MANSVAYKLGILNDNNFEFMSRSLERRANQAEKVLSMNLLPVVVEAHRKSKKQLPSKMYGIDAQSQIAVLQQTLFQNLKLRPYEGVYLFSSNCLVQQNLSVKEIYDRYHNKEDKILYIKYCPADDFGNNQ